MIILQQNLATIIIGRDSGFPIATFMFFGANGTLDTVVVSVDATDEETLLLRKVAYQYAKKIWEKKNTDTNPWDLEFFTQILNNRKETGILLWDLMFNIFQEYFDVYQANPDKELVDDRYFKESGCFIKNAYTCPQDAMDEIVRQVRNVTDVYISLDMETKENVLESIIYTVSLAHDSSKEFAFWYAPWPQEENTIHNLHIVPGYHPASSSQGKKTCELMINGDNNTFLSSSVIASVYSPKEARKQECLFFSSWENMKHACKAAGKSFTFALYKPYEYSQELVDAAVNLILTALGNHDGYYVGVCGGFYPPYNTPEAIAAHTEKKIPCNELRGTESHCMWTYDVLKEEGVLEEAYVPQWFYEENWIEFFK